jgi:hypothetical protein
MGVTRHDRAFGSPPGGVLHPLGFTRPKIAVPAGMGRATDLEMDPVSCEKCVGRRPQFDLDTSASILLRLVLFFSLIETQ